MTWKFIYASLFEFVPEPCRLPPFRLAPAALEAWQARLAVETGQPVAGFFRWLCCLAGAVVYPTEKYIRLHGEICHSILLLIILIITYKL